jgi:hypothetical protein
MLALHGPMGPFKAVENIIGKKLLGPFGNIDTAFPRSGEPVQSSRKQSLLGPFVNIETGLVCSGGPIQSSRKQSLLGSSVNIDAGYACFGGLIQSCRKHSREETSGPIRENRCWLCMVPWAHSKRSETHLGRNYWAHSGTSIPYLHAPVGSFKVVGHILRKKLLGPSVNIDATFPRSSGPIQGDRELFLRALVGPFKTFGNVFLIHTGPIRYCRNLLF